MLTFDDIYKKLRRQQILIANLKDACDRFTNVTSQADKTKALRDMIGIIERIDNFNVKGELN